MMPTEPHPALVDRAIRLALEEDVGTGDITTRATVPAGSTCRAVVIAKARLVVAGLPYFARVFELVDERVAIVPRVEEGCWVEPGTTLAELKGPTHSVLIGERTALNFMQRLSGTATLTRRFAEALEGTDTRVVDTRKTTPGMRLMQKYAVRVAGGANHRFGLDSGVLIKENHIAACGSVAAAVEQARRVVPHVLRVEIEVTDRDELDAALAAGADVVLLDNMGDALLTECVARARACGRPVVTEASGNVTLERLGAIAKTGVDLVSVGALTHSAPAADLSLKITG